MYTVALSLLRTQMDGNASPAKVNIWFLPDLWIRMQGGSKTVMPSRIALAYLVIAIFDTFRHASREYRGEITVLPEFAGVDIHMPRLQFKILSNISLLLLQKGNFLKLFVHFNHNFLEFNLILITDDPSLIKSKLFRLRSFSSPHKISRKFSTRLLLAGLYSLSYNSEK